MVLTRPAGGALTNASPKETRVNEAANGEDHVKPPLSGATGAELLEMNEELVTPPRHTVDDDSGRPSLLAAEPGSASKSDGAAEGFSVSFHPSDPFYSADQEDVMKSASSNPSVPPLPTLANLAQPSPATCVVSLDGGVPTTEGLEEQRIGGDQMNSFREFLRKRLREEEEEDDAVAPLQLPRIEV